MNSNEIKLRLSSLRNRKNQERSEFGIKNDDLRMVSNNLVLN